MNADAHPRIARDPKIMMGKPTIAGTRVPVEAVVRHFAAGADMASVLRGFPDLGEDDVRAALEYAAVCVSQAHAVAAPGDFLSANQHSSVIPDARSAIRNPGPPWPVVSD